MSTADLIYAVAWPPAWACTWAAISRACRFGDPWAAALAWACAGVSEAAGFAIAGDWQAAGAGAAQAAIGAWLWRRGRRRRAPRAWGAKSRALAARLAAKAREAARPRPVLRPVPGGLS